MQLSQRLEVYAAPADEVSHLGPREGDHDEGLLTLCGLFLLPMTASAPTVGRRLCVECEALAS